MKKSTLKIALCGAGGTGKGTLAKRFAREVSNKCQLHLLESQNEHIAKIMFPGLSKYNQVMNKDKKAYQYAILSAQISQEKEDISFISERSVLDYIPYAYNNDSNHDWCLDYEKMIYMYLNEHPYDYLVYVPLEFSCGEHSGSGFKERDFKSQQKTDEAIKDIINSDAIRRISLNTRMQIMTVSGSPQRRVEQMMARIFDYD